MSKYSSRNVRPLWCSSCVWMYLITWSRWERECENAPYPSCQAKCPTTNLFSLIHLLEADFTSRSTSAIFSSGDSSKKMCTWSFQPPTAKGWHFFYRMMPPMNWNRRSRKLSASTFSRPLTENTQWIFSCEYVLAIWNRNIVFPTELAVGCCRNKWVINWGAGATDFYRISAQFYDLRQPLWPPCNGKMTIALLIYPIYLHRCSISTQQRAASSIVSR